MELPYIIRVALIMAAMYLTYKVFLSKDSFHALNRFTILASVAMSFVIPLLPIPSILGNYATPATNTAMVGIGEITATIAEGEPTTSLVDYLPYLMVAGVAIFFAKFFTSTISIVIQTVKNKKINLQDGILLIISDTIKSPVSWLRYIFMNSNDYHENSREILVHEMAHINYRHSIDLIFMDLACCIQWFNPAIWLFRMDLRAVHEFQADQKVLASGFNAKQYQTLLIKKAAGRNWNSVASSLNHSNLKKRITMMSNQKKSASAAFKALLPVAVAALCAVTLADCNSQKESMLNPVADHNWAQNMNANGDNWVQAQPFNAENPSPTIRVKDADGKETTISNALGPNAVYIIDGERVANIDNIAPEAIASIQIYKGAAAAKWTSDPDAGVLIITSKKAEAAAMAEETFYEVVEDMPEFPGGDLELRKFIAENVRYPQDAKDNNEQGTVYVKFIVDKTGKVTEPTIVRGTGCESLDEEAIRVVNTIPDFTPGRQRGQNVAVSLVMPIKFALSSTETPAGDNKANGVIVIGE
ncbi:MAG: TonB family protein [Bacteroidales bacterium]|nr:TonB family protein [Bacteroidales bacterium]